MTSLTDRVTLLESMLKAHGTQPPDATYPPKTTRGDRQTDQDQAPDSMPSTQPQQQFEAHMAAENASPASTTDNAIDMSEDLAAAHVEELRDSVHHEATGGTPIDDQNQGLVTRLLSSTGHLSFDQLSGRLRYYGPTANSHHLYLELTADDSKPSRESLEQARRCEKVVRTLPLETHEYLMNLFWQHYNGVLHVVHQEAFNEDREHGRTQFYSGFLHVCILAMGYRFADKSRPDVQRIALPDRESLLHREAKYMLDLELEHPGGIPSVAALLIFADGEVGVGRDNTGWMYAGMAMRLAYDIGLHLDSSASGMSQREVDIRRMTLWACVIYDRYWSLFLGRPTTLKSADLEIYSLANQFERLGTCQPAGPDKSLNTRVYEALIDLMEIAGKIVENPEHRSQSPSATSLDQSAYFRMASIDRELHKWATNLPKDLQYTEENRASAPYSFYLLHQQYYAVLILLHRPFARYDDPNSPNAEDAGNSALDSHFSRASRAICTKSAVSMARIFWHHREKFDGKQIFCIGMQHAGTAATALIAALAYIPDTKNRSNNMQYLEVLHAALRDMSHAYQPAERMSRVLDAVMVELRGGPISTSKGSKGKRPSVTARRGSTTAASESAADRPTAKRRQTSQAKEPKSMQPPSSAAKGTHTHRASDASDRHSVISHLSFQPPQPQPDAFMVTPTTEGSSVTGGWTHIDNTDAFSGNAAMPSMPPQQLPQNNFNFPSANFQGTDDWTGDGLDHDDFPDLNNAGGFTNLSDMPEFARVSGIMALPSELDWRRWHGENELTASGRSEDVPRGRSHISVHQLESPGMGSIVNG